MSLIKCTEPDPKWLVKVNVFVIWRALGRVPLNFLSEPRLGCLSRIKVKLWSRWEVTCFWLFRSLFLFLFFPVLSPALPLASTLMRQRSVDLPTVRAT